MLLLVLVAGTVVLPLLLGVDRDELENLGYAGVFIANFFGSATLFVPVPGLTAAGQALIVVTAETLNPWGVALLGGTAMSLAEITAYVAGRVGRGMGEQYHPPLGGRWGQLMQRAAAFVDRLMLRWGVPTLLVLAAIPNPLFDIAGILAGMVRFPVWKFLLSTWAGKTLKAIFFAGAGSQLFGRIG